jgi:hypothetical protein
MWTLLVSAVMSLTVSPAAAAPRIWVQYTELPEALMVSNDTGAEVKSCKVEWQIRYDKGRHYTEVALVDLPAHGEVKVSDCREWWDERLSKTLDVTVTLYAPDGKQLATQDYEGVFKLVARHGLPTDGWSAAASRGANTKAAFDGDLGSRWDTGGKQEVGDWYMLDMGKPQRIAGLIIDARQSANDYPSGLIVDVSGDGDNWLRVAKLDDTEPVNRKGRIDLSFDPVSARYICLMLTRPHGDHWFWSIHELSVLPPKEG